MVVGLGTERAEEKGREWAQKWVREWVLLSDEW